MDECWDGFSLGNLEHEIILYLLREKRGYVREISRSLNKPHSTISRKLKNLTQEGVLDCERKGKNKVYFLKKNLRADLCIYNSERYKMIKLLYKYPRMNVILQDILDEVSEGLVVLFGSYADLTANEDSDIDIYIKGRNQKTRGRIEDIHSRVNVKIGEFNTEDPLIREIIKKHIILKGVEEFYQYLNR